MHPKWIPASAISQVPGTRQSSRHFIAHPVQVYEGCDGNVCPVQVRWSQPGSAAANWRTSGSPQAGPAVGPASAYRLQNSSYTIYEYVSSVAQSVEATAPCWRSPSPRRWQRSVGNAKLRSPAAWPGGRPEEPKSGLDAALADLIDDHRSGRQLVCVFSLQQAMKVFWLSCRPCRADLVFILGLIAASILSGPLSTCRDVKANPGRRTTVRHLPIGMAEVLSRDLLRLLVLALQVGYLACRDLACSGSDTLCPGGASELHGEGSAGWAGWCGWCSKCARSFRLAPNLFANSLAPWRQWVFRSSCSTS